MKNYVVGFLFNSEMTRVLLIHKRHGPQCVIEKWNGVGGKIEANESPYQAMVREFEEEAGISTREHEWRRFTTLVGTTATVHFFWMKDSCLLQQARDCTDEETGTFLTSDIGLDNVVVVVPNLRWMIPFLCDETVCHELPDINFDKEPAI